MDLQRNDLPREAWLPEDIHALFAGQAFRLRFDDLTPDRLEEFLAHLKARLPESWQQAERPDREEEVGYYPGVLQENFPLPNDLQQAPVSPTPYVGLRPFRRGDARLFYGRSREIYQLCCKLIHESSRLLLLDGYSGTGKSSLLQAGLIPRLEAQGWAIAYARREDDKIGGLPALLAAKRGELAAAHGPRLFILDQVEEVLTNPILSLPQEVESLIDDLVIALEEDPNLKVILGFRSEFAAHLQRQLDRHAEQPAYDSDNTVYPLERPGLVEAIRSVSADPSLNGPGKPYYLRFRPSRDLPETIADRLIESKAGSHIAPLLQVNLELLWQRCQRDDGVVEITGTAIRDFIDTHEVLLDHYLGKIRQQITAAQVDDQRLLELLNFYVEEKPASALRPDQEFEDKFGSDSYAPVLRDACKQLYLLYSKGSGEKAITRLSHDSLAEVIYGRYSRLTEEKVATRGALALESLKREIDGQIETLRYRQALDTLDQMMTVQEQRQELYPYFFELGFFWNEAGGQQETERVLQQWIDSGLLTGEQREQTFDTLTTEPNRAQVRRWLGFLDPVRYRDMQTRYLAPEQSVMVRIERGQFMMGDSVERPVHPVRLDSFWLANAPVTWWQYALYLFAIQQAPELEGKAASWGLKGDHPAYQIDWYEAVAYCNWLSEQMGLTPAHEIDRDHPDPGNLSEHDQKRWTVRLLDDATGFRLPTEAEWEYACRAGTTTQYSFGDNEKELVDYGWFGDNSGGQTQPVRVKLPNQWGLYDMHGNVWEWCQDWYDEQYYQNSPMSNPTGPPQGACRVSRGGSWDRSTGGCRSAYRDGGDPEARNIYRGFRLARSYSRRPLRGR